MVGLSLSRMALFTLTIRPHPVAVWIIVDFFRSQLCSKTWGCLAGGMPVRKMGADVLAGSVKIGQGVMVLN